MDMSVILQFESEIVPDPARVTAGWLGGVFFFGMFAAVILLWRNMNSRLKRLDQKRAEELEQ